MTDSLFDPTNPGRARQGGRFTGPDADDRSNMPDDVVDGEVSEEEIAEQEHQLPKPPPANPEQ